MISNLRDICFIKQYYESILLYINSYKKGHDILRYRIKGDNKYLEVHITSPFVIINDLDKEGYYEFYTINSNNINSQVNNVYTIYFLHENIEDNLQQIINNMPKNLQDNDVISLLQKDINKLYIKNNDIKETVSYICYKKYLNTKDIQSEEENIYYTFLITAQQYNNNQSVFWNKNISEDFNIDYNGSGYISTNGLISKIVILDEQNKLYKSIKCEGLLDIDLLINKPGYYTIKLYEQDDLINILNFIQFKDLLKTKTWQLKKDQEHIESIINNNQFNNVSYSDIQLTDNELIYLNQENAKNPTFPILDKLEIMDNGNNTISIYIQDYDLLHTFGNNFHIAIKEEDTLFTDYFNDYSLINNNIIKINLAKHFLNRQMLFFIKDQNNKIINPLVRFSYDMDFTSYYKKVCNIKMNSYLKRLIPLISKRTPESLDFIKSATDTILNNNENNNWVYYWRKLIEMILIYGKSINRNNTPDISYVLTSNA